MDNLRKQIKIRLQNISPEEQVIASKNIATKIIQNKIFTESKKIACYIPIENEVDTKIIIETIWAQNKDCYLPALDPKKEKELCFAHFMPNDKLIKPHGKFLEPEIKFIPCGLPRDKAMEGLPMGERRSSPPLDQPGVHTPGTVKKFINRKITPPQNLDLVIVPLLGFNSGNFRLGRGIGYYDRTFAFKKDLLIQSKPYLIGIGYKWQLLEFENNSWDIPMNEIIFA